MTEYLPVVKSSQQLSTKIDTASTLLGRGLATIQNKQLTIADQDARYRKYRDTYDRITDYGWERRFNPELLSKTGKQFDLFSDEPVNALQPLIDQTIQLTDAFRQLKQLADEGYGKAYFIVARMYWGGQGVAKNVEKYNFFNKCAFQWLFNHRELIDSEIWRDLAYLYQNGLGTQQDDEQAFYWFRKSAESGNISAQGYLGWMYERGRGLKVDSEMAAFWYQNAAEQGHPTAQYYLGKMYQDGRGMDQEYTQSVFWYRKAAEQGQTQAQAHLGCAYAEGVGGLKRDYKQSAYWFQRAAELGYASAQLTLGDYYEYGRGVEQNNKKAAYWYQRAAEQGESISSISQGFLSDIIKNNPDIDLSNL